MTRASEHQHFAKGAGFVALATGLFAAQMGWGIGGETAVSYVDDLATPLAALAATALCLRVGFQARDTRAFWWLLAAACGAWTLAETIWGVYELILHDEVPVPSWADLGYLAGIPLAAAALLVHPAMRGSGTQRARSALDGLILAAALLFLSWSAVLGPLWRSADLSTLGGVVALAYPFGDLVIVFFVVLAIRGMTRGDRLALWCLLGGLLAISFSDTAYSYLTGVKSYETGSLIDAGWFAGYLGIALGAWCSRGHTRAGHRAALASPAPASLAAPFLPVIAGLSFAAIEIELGHRLDGVAWISAFVLVMLVLGRQGLLLRDLLTSGTARTGYDRRGDALP